MKYFVDTEFIEGIRKPFFGKPYHRIDLISIGIVCEDGRTYYAISNEFNPRHANDWVKENVLSKLPEKPHRLNGLSEYSAWKSRKQIAQEIIAFCNNAGTKHIPFDPKDHPPFTDEWAKPEFYGYYADYDWVVFCSLFGRMIDLPKGFPMYCRDLKQILDEMYMFQENKYPDKTRLQAWLHDVKRHPDYPKQDNEHDALDDAKWNFRLYQFMQKIKNPNSTRILTSTQLSDGQQDSIGEK